MSFACTCEIDPAWQPWQWAWHHMHALVDFGLLMQLLEAAFSETYEPWRSQQDEQHRLEQGAQRVAEEAARQEQAKQEAEQQEASAC